MSRLLSFCEHNFMLGRRDNSFYRNVLRHVWVISTSSVPTWGFCCNYAEHTLNLLCTWVLTNSVCSNLSISITSDFMLVQASNDSEKLRRGLDPIVVYFFKWAARWYRLLQIQNFIKSPVREILYAENRTSILWLETERYNHSATSRDRKQRKKNDWEKRKLKQCNLKYIFLRNIFEILCNEKNSSDFLNI